MEPTPRVISVSTLEGDPVKNMEGEHIGEIEEIMLDMTSGRVAYVVLSFGGFLGVGDKFFALPWSSITIDTESKVLLVDIDKERLENAPGFDKDNWPDSADHEWLGTVYDHYGAARYW